MKKKKVNNKTNKTTTTKKNTRTYMTVAKRGKRKESLSKMDMIAKTPKKIIKKTARVADKAMDRVDADMIAKGAAMMAVAAGMVATGAMLAQEKNRKKLGKVARGGMRSFGEIMSDLSEEARDHYPAIAHQITKEKRGR